MTTYLSVCSGLEGASLAVHSLGWTPVGFAEIEAFPSAIIAERFGSNMPGEPLSRNAPPNFGDFTTIDVSALGTVDLLIGGTPCQAFSIAGKRMSLADARGNLTLAYAVLAHELARSNGLRNALWENVPGALSTSDNAFGCFLGALVGTGSAVVRPGGRGWPDAGMVSGPRARAAWRLLDAQYFGVAQRRERVFVVADFGNGADPVEVLFERPRVPGNPAPRRETGKTVAPTLAARTRGGGGLGTDFDCDGGLVAAFGGNRTGGELEVATAVSAHALRAEGFDAGEDGTGRGTPIVPVAFDARQSDVCIYGDKAAPLDTDGYSQAIAFTSKDYGGDAAADLSPTLRAMGHGETWANGGGQVAVAFAIQERAVSENPDAGPGGKGVQEGIAYTLEARQQPQAVAFQTRGSNLYVGEISGTLGTNADRASGGAPMVAHNNSFAFDLRGREGGAMPEGPHDTANIRAASGGSSRSYVAQAYGIRSDAIRDGVAKTPSMDAEGHVRLRDPGFNVLEETAPTLDAGAAHIVGTKWAVRRLTPTECERLQGVPDGWTDIPWRGKAKAPDGPRYKALGNSWAIPVVCWICTRIDAALPVPTKDRSHD